MAQKIQLFLYDKSFHLILIAVCQNNAVLCIIGERIQIRYASFLSGIQPGGQLQQILIAGIIFRKNDKAIQLLLLQHVHFHPENRLDMFFFTCMVKRHGTMHDMLVSQCDRCITAALGCRNDFGNCQGTLQQGIAASHM